MSRLDAAVKIVAGLDPFERVRLAVAVVADLDGDAPTKATGSRWRTVARVGGAG